MGGWKSKKNDNGKVSHFKDEKKIRDSSEPEINVEVNINTDELDDFAEEKRKQKVIDIYEFDELDESAKEKAREWYREGDSYFLVDWVAQTDGIIYDKKSNLADYDVFNNYHPTSYDLERGRGYVQFEKLEIRDEEKLGKMLEIPESVLKKVDISFRNERNETNTKIEFRDTFYNVIDLDESYDEYKEYVDDADDNSMVVTRLQFEKLQKASEKWDKLMDDALEGMISDFEYQQSDEAVDDNIRANEYEFDIEGNRVVV